MINSRFGTKGRRSRLSDYIRALCSAIRQQTEDVEVDVQSDELELGIDRALPVGLILNEAAMNSIKHAFGPDGGQNRCPTGRRCWFWRSSPYCVR